MRAGDSSRSNYSVSPCENVGDNKGVGDKKAGDSVDRGVEEDSDEEDLGMDMGEA